MLTTISFMDLMAIKANAGEKTQTRRLINPQPGEHPSDEGYGVKHRFPYGDIGSILDVKEAYYQLGHWEPDPERPRKTGKMAFKFVPDDEQVLYLETPPEKYRVSMDRQNYKKPMWHKRLGRFMPKKYVRNKLIIVSYEPQRLQDITEEDAIAEGVEEYAYGYWKNYLTSFCGGRPNTKLDFKNPIESFKTLWQSINGEESYNNNPYVWKIVFNLQKKLNA